MFTGDIAILLHSGMSMKKALFYNTLSAACGILGLVGGISLGENPAANQWIFAIAGGIFLYVPLVDMVSLKSMINPVTHGFVSWIKARPL